VARIVKRIDSLVPRRAASYGGKARGLAALARGGFPVPRAYAIAGDCFVAHCDAHLPRDARPHVLLRQPQPSPERLEEYAAAVREAPLDPALLGELRETFRWLRRDGAQSVAVRSSSTAEDGSDQSGAGLHATVLHVESEDALADAVRACWASFYGPAAQSYLRKTGFEEAAVGVVVQAMVPADIAGVLFTVNPLSGDAGEVVIDAAYGLGSAVVDGSVSPDTLRIDKASGLPRDRIIGGKAIRRVAEHGEVVEHEVAEADRERLALSETQVDLLFQLALRIEKHFGGPRDVEWAFRGDQLFLLQSRPVTAALQPATKRWQKRRDVDREKIVWSNVNVGEALPGVATPLTWSILSRFSELGFRRAFGSLGCTVPKDAELVGNFRGRIYLNLSEFMGILTQVPGLRPKMILALGGGGEVDRLEEEVESQSSWGFLRRLPLTVARFARENLALTERLEEWEEAFALERTRLGQVDPRILPAPALAKMLEDVERLLDESGSIMLTVYGNVLASAVLLTTALRVVAGSSAEALQRELLTGIADLDSAAPGIALWHIAEAAREESAAREAILEGDASLLRVEDLPEGRTRRSLGRFLEAYGHRGTREAEIMEPRWREDPTLLFATLQAHLRREGGPRPLDLERSQRAQRERAEQDLRDRVPAPFRPAFRHLLVQVQRFMRLRERLRGYVTEVLGFYRTVALDASRRVELREPDAGQGAAFYLTESELHQALRADLSVAIRVRQRRRQHERDLGLPEPPDTFVGYPPPVPEPIPTTGAMRGLAASSGKATGRARLLHTAADAAAFEAGEILVCGSADVGWAPLFLVAGGVVTDLGGPLSHASIVLREYGVPAVVNTKVGTRRIRDGDRILVDADRGEVRILERAPE
tara:strand:+ start:72 stop:2711 length:2640 start_codon:yes stop_codon:yes gene_type:complete